MTSDVLIERQEKAGRIRLNRPKAIHALNTAMCDAINLALEAWRDDRGIGILLIDHAEGRGFCAGGDIRMIAESGANGGAAARAFFRNEYRMNHQLFTWGKPSVVFMDGITMGGGVGLSLPCRYRIATEHTRFAMPETGIGLFPDVGGGWYLSRLPGRIGQYLALTGARLNGAECCALGLATHYLPHAHLEEAKARLAQAPEKADAILAALSVEPPIAPILAQADTIARLFGPDRYEDILALLAADSDGWADEQLEILKTKSPQTCKVSLRLLKEGAAMRSFADEMAQEYAVASHVCTRPDFIEGVRAVIIDKDNAPRWSPATPEGVTPDILNAIFAPLPPEEAWTPHD